MSQVVLVSDGSHQNAPSSPVNNTQSTFDGGYPPRAADQRKGSIIDVSQHTMLRLSLEVTGITNTFGQSDDAAELHLLIEHSGSSSPGQGLWRTLHRFKPMGLGGPQQIILSAFQPFVRASWFWSRHNDPYTTIRDAVAFSFKLDGEGIPDAA